MNYKYHFIKVDCSSPKLRDAASKYKALRLEALRQSPTAFSSTLELESQFPDELWASRLQDPEKETFACVATSDNGYSEWVGQVTLRGPLPATEFLPPPDSGQPHAAPDEDEEKWQMLSLYTLPEHRGKKLASRLCGSAFDFLRSRGETSAPCIVVRIIVKAENKASLKLYDGLGFQRAGYSTLEEALRANGEAGLIPGGHRKDDFTARNKIVMLLRLERKN